MSELDETSSYSHDVTVSSFRDYFRFLTDLYMEDSDIIEPPEGGWPTVSQEFAKLFGKSDEVIALLRSLPYISASSNKWGIPPHGTALCYWADWQQLADMGTGGDMSGLEANLKALTEGALEPVPAHVIGLTNGDRENKTFLLDTKFGVVYVCNLYLRSVPYPSDSHFPVTFNYLYLVARV